MGHNFWYDIELSDSLLKDKFKFEFNDKPLHFNNNSEQNLTNNFVCYNYKNTCSLNFNIYLRIV